MESLRRREKILKLRELVETVRKKGVGALDDDAILRLHYLYRFLLAELARARRDEPGGERERDLNMLAARSHNIIVHTGGRIPLSRIYRFFSVDLPRSVRAHLAIVGVCIFFFAAGVAFSYIFLRLNPDRAHYLLDPMVIENAEKGFSDESFEQSTRMWQAKPLFVSFYVTNNTKVAFTAFGLGIFFGIPTIAVLFYNGVAIGGTFAIVERAGLTHNLMGFVSPHGGIELAAIFLAAAAGVALGLAILVPGRLTRARALRERAYSAVTLVIGAALMLVVAAVIESLVSPLAIPNEFKYAIGIVNLVGIWTYLLSDFFRAGGGPHLQE